MEVGLKLIWDSSLIIGLSEMISKIYEQQRFLVTDRGKNEE